MRNMFELEDLVHKCPAKRHRNEKLKIVLYFSLACVERDLNSSKPLFNYVIN